MITLPFTREEITHFVLAYSNKPSDWSLIEEMDYTDDHRGWVAIENKLHKWIIAFAKKFPELTEYEIVGEQSGFKLVGGIIVDVFVCGIRIDQLRFRREEMLRYVSPGHEDDYQYPYYGTYFEALSKYAKQKVPEGKSI